MGSGNGLVPISCNGIALEQGSEEDGNTPGPGQSHQGEDHVSKGVSDTEETIVEEKNGHLDGNDGEGVEYFIAPIQLDIRCQCDYMHELEVLRTLYCSRE